MNTIELKNFLNIILEECNLKELKFGDIRVPFVYDGNDFYIEKGVERTKVKNEKNVEKILELIFSELRERFGSKIV